MRRPVSGFPRSRERGAIVAVVALLLFVLLTFLVLVMNVAHGYSVRGELQNAGDSAALAAAARIDGRPPGWTPPGVPPQTDLGPLQTSIGTATNTALLYGAAHRTDSTSVALLGGGGGDVCFGTVLPPTGNPPVYTFTLRSCGGPPAIVANTSAINAVRIDADRNAGHPASGGPLAVVGSGLLGGSPTINVSTRAIAARFAPCSVGQAAPLAFSLTAIDGFLPCWQSVPMPWGSIGFTLYGGSLPTPTGIRDLLMNLVWTPSGPHWVCDPNFGATQSTALLTAPKNVAVKNGGTFTSSQRLWLVNNGGLQCLQGQTMDVGIVQGSVGSSGPMPLTTWAQVRVVGVSPGSITLRRECGASEQDAGPAAGRCRAVGLLSTRPVLVQ